MCQGLVVGMEEGRSNVSREGRRAWPRESRRAGLSVLAASSSRHRIMVLPISPEAAELSPSPRTAAGTRHPCGCRYAPYVLQPTPRGGEVVLPGCPPSSSGVSHPIPCRDAPGSFSPPFQLRAAASAPSSGSLGVARPAEGTSPSLLSSLPAASSRASDGESVTVS